MRIAAFALFAGIVYLSLGLLGFVPAALQPAAPDAAPLRLAALYGDLLGLFPVNVVHSAVHVAVGAWGVAAGRGITSAKWYARALAVIFGLLALIGLIPQLNTFVGLLPVHGHDVWLHAGTAALAGYFGWRTEPADQRHADDRRQQSLPVGRERRLRHGDRRTPGSEV
jgi:hypothetical protein